MSFSSSETLFHPSFVSFVPVTFLNPLILFALAAAAVPLVLHMLSRRRARRVEFSSLRFLRELERSSMTRLRLREILLLILRTALIILIVLAFARPASQGYVSPFLASVSGGATYAPASIVIAIDNSPSMLRHDENGELLKQAKDLARRITALATERDEISLVTLTNNSQSDLPRASHSPALVREAITKLSASPRSSHAGDAIRLAASILTASHNANKELYVITDGTRRTFDSSETLRGMFPTETKFFPITLSRAHNVNVGIDTAIVATQILEQSGTVDVEAVLHNYSDERLASRTVSLLLNGRPAAQRAVDLDAHASARVTLSARIEERGWIEGKVEIEPDDALYDNTRSVALFVPEKTNVLLVAASRDESVFLETALAQNVVEGKEQFSLRRIAPQELGSVDPSEYDAVILIDAPPPAAEAHRLITYVQSGGGLVLFGGDRLAVEKNFLAACGITAHGVVSDDGGTLRATSLDRSHPLFRGVFAQPDGELDLPHVRRVVTTTLTPIISLSSGAPLVGESHLGSGKIIFMGVIPIPAWSDLPLSSIFLPLAVRSLHYVSEANERTSFSADEDISLGLSPRIRADAELVLEGQDSGRTVLHARATSSGDRVAEISDAPLDFSRVVDSKTGIVVGAIATSSDHNESDPTTLSEDALRSYVRSFGIANDHIVTFDAHGDLEANVRQTRYGAELWKLALLLAIVIAVAEMVVAHGLRRIKRVE